LHFVAAGFGLTGVAADATIWGEERAAGANGVEARYPVERSLAGSSTLATRFGPRLRMSSKRIRSSSSTGAYIPLGKKTSACVVWS